MDVQATRKMRHLYQVDPEFRHALQEDPAAALVRWGLAISETASGLADAVCKLLDLSSEEILTSVLDVALPDWYAISPESAVSR
jgi:hypothetical protein